MRSFILLQDATIVTPTLSREIKVLMSQDLLIHDNRIVSIGPRIDTSIIDVKIINCKGKLVCPGFVDTHHHVWQSQLKGRHADQNLFQYLLHGNLRYSQYTPDDVFWGQLAGCLEMIDAGTTTVVDHAHMNLTAAHSQRGVLATISSGIRSVFCYALMPRVATWNPTFAFQDDGPLASWAVEQLEGLATGGPYGDGRVQIGLAFDSVHDKLAVRDVFLRARKSGVKLITCHHTNDRVSDRESPVQILAKQGLLGRDVLFSHLNNFKPVEAELLNKHQCSISSTPMTELQMGAGYPVCFSEETKAICSLGVDCHSNNSCDLVSQMRVALEAERARQNDLWNQQNPLGANPITVTTKHAFILSTIQGAKAINMESQIGTLEVGKLADIIIFDAQSPGMICAAEEDPVAAIVMHSSIRDIETVIIDGKLRKENGRLLPVQAPGEVGERDVTWKHVAEELLRSRAELKPRLDSVRVEDLQSQIVKAVVSQKFGTSE